MLPANKRRPVSTDTWSHLAIFETYSGVSNCSENLKSGEVEEFLLENSMDNIFRVTGVYFCVVC